MRTSIPGERRIYTRVQTEGLALVRRHGRLLGAFEVDNMSIGGALLSGSTSLRVGERVHLTVHLTPSVVELDAKVVRSVDDRGYAVSFDGAARVLSAIDDHVRSRFPA